MAEPITKDNWPAALPIDVLDRLRRDFGNRADAVAALLLARRRMGDAMFVGDRLARCVIQAAGGDEQRVQQLLDLAVEDYRDVIVAGEYDASMRQIMDLRASLLIDSPEKLWVGEVACLMASRDYRLTAIDSRPATVGPISYTTDYGEGTATFVGPKGEMEVEKKDRLWAVCGNRRDLAIYNLDRRFDDEQAFHDALSGYLLSATQEAAGGLTAS